jgi:hypothetical protein
VNTRSVGYHGRGSEVGGMLGVRKELEEQDIVLILPEIL